MAFTTSFCCPQVAKNVITDLKLFKFNTFCHQFKYVCRNELKLTGVGRCKRVLVLCGNLKLLGARQQVKDPNTDSPDRVEAFSDLLTKYNISKTFTNPRDLEHLYTLLVEKTTHLISRKQLKSLNSWFHGTHLTQHAIWIRTGSVTWPPFTPDRLLLLSFYKVHHSENSESSSSGTYFKVCVAALHMW